MKNCDQVFLKLCVNIFIIGFDNFQIVIIFYVYFIKIMFVCCYIWEKKFIFYCIVIVNEFN